MSSEPPAHGRAHRAMATADAGVYSEVKKAILRRYDISEETYRQRCEVYIELATRLADLFKKWTIDCDTVETVVEKMLIEQLLNIMPANLRVWLSEKKPTTGLEVGRLLARKRNRVDPPKQNGKREGMGARRCHTCRQEGHLARNCTKKDSSREGSVAVPVETENVGGGVLVH